MSGNQSGTFMKRERRFEEAQGQMSNSGNQSGKEVAVFGSTGLDLWDFADFNWDLVEIEDDGLGLPGLNDVALRPLSPDSGLLMGSNGDDTDPSSGPSVTAPLSPQQPSNRDDVSVKNRNAAAATAARLNRLKKKEYVTGLELRASGLQTENQELRAENQRLSRRVEDLQGEARYLRAVLANQSSLAGLLNRLSGLDGMKMSSSLCRDIEGHDHDYAIPSKRLKSEEDGGAAGGVCLHVDQGHVSIEFCSGCAQNASSSLKIFFSRCFPAILDGWV
ncbi:CREB/ATF bZIP transcription factor [Heptranchias perlo]|uniref:CREB/ATF bZIP transcription factor n=1 Tax=Heptranchias perlo TaxID=212740 RepID=UPI003559AEA9